MTPSLSWLPQIAYSPSVADGSVLRMSSQLAGEAATHALSTTLSMVVGAGVGDGMAGVGGGSESTVVTLIPSNLRSQPMMLSELPSFWMMH